MMATKHAAPPPPQAAMRKLNIPHHKSYYPYRRDTIEKVRRDEEEARSNEAENERRMLLASCRFSPVLAARACGCQGVQYGQTVLALPPYTSLSSFQRPPQSPTLAHDSHKQGGIPLMQSERAYAGEDECARSARATPSMLPSSPSLAARLPLSRARTLHVSQEACFFTHMATVLHFRCATQLSSAPRLRAQFSAYRPCTTSSTTSSSVITTRDRNAHQALHNPTSITTLRTKARPKPKRSTTRTTTRGLSPSTTAPWVLSPRLR
ncbi:hypothetical protein K438DRAFT_1966026 [Mycena galopus ATCC 62051]|nr:hypothetical protein K438DRAFT_1966026 [Mycena galopus ATCC 62051]